MTQARCSATNRDGRPCSAPALPGRSLCAWHDPSMRERVAAGRAKGGKGKSNASRARRRLPDDLLSLREVQALLCVVLKDVTAGRTEVGVATAAATVARAIAAVAQVGDLDERLGAHRSTLRVLLRRMADRGQVVAHGNGRYSLPPLPPETPETDETGDASLPAEAVSPVSRVTGVSGAPTAPAVCLACRAPLPADGSACATCHPRAHAHAAKREG